MTGPLQTLLTLCLLGIAALPQAAAGGNAFTSPEQIDGVSKVDADGLIELVTRTPGLILIDSRISADRKEGFIEGSISLPDNETDCTTLAARIPALHTPALFYCNGIRCRRSAHAAQIARDCGYSRVYWFRTGIEEWRRQQYPLVR
ncbi:MAG TPA: rhodanese-like domain-containing protein [Gammaproteobacteria bacterium]|nr:rhodanese-like domain-containing protein [Gammaproteobacteria bacterium]